METTLVAKVHSTAPHSVCDAMPAPSGSDATRAQILQNASPAFAGRDAILVTASSDATRVRDLCNALPALAGRDAILASASSEDTGLHRICNTTIIGLNCNTAARFAHEVPTPLSIRETTPLESLHPSSTNTLCPIRAVLTV
jgi:hypothetical protein